MKRLFLGIALGLVLAQPAFAEMTADELMHIYDTGDPTSRDEVAIAADGNYNGLAWASSYLTSQHATPIFCPVPNHAMTRQETMEMLRASMAKDARIGKQPYGLAMLLAVQETYPCP
ncbi:MAG TPA: hypothetical protein VGG48_10280 [Rhizomicrobium sp.]|jgi:hypothetical protein